MQWIPTALTNNTTGPIIKKIDFLIIGQGLAGSSLAWHLLERGKRIVVINNPSRNISSHVAAGIYNPLTGRKMVSTWMADKLFPYLQEFYTRLANALKANFFHPLPMFRPFLTEPERATWKETPPPLYSIYQATSPHPWLVPQHGGMLVTGAGYLDVPYFLESIRMHLRQCGAYVEGNFKHEDLDITNTSITYQGICASKIIFCEGPTGRHNPFFSNLPFRPVKGEILQVQYDHPLDMIYNRPVFVVPTSTTKRGSISHAAAKPKTFFRQSSPETVGYKATVGATYDWRDLSVAPSENARLTLEKKLQSFIQLPYTIINHRAGIRPATFDRRPFVGIHSSYPSIAFFNGLGSKGVSLAPYFAYRLVAYLLDNIPLPREVCLGRVFPSLGS